MTHTYCPECQNEIELREVLSPGQSENSFCENCQKPVRVQSDVEGSSPILVVEDTTAVRELLAEMLEVAGYSVETASDGAEALEKVKTFRPSLVLLDLYLPKLTGFEVLEALSQSPDGPPILVMSGTHEPDSIQKVSTLGADGFIPKSALRDTLLFRVESLLAGGLAQASAS